MRTALTLACALVAGVAVPPAVATPLTVLADVGDLDRDGHDDLAVTTSRSLAVYGSRTGHVLWRRELVPFTSFSRARLGPDAGAGLLFVEHRYDGASAGGTKGDFTTTISAVDRAGRTLWQRSYPESAVFVGDSADTGQPHAEVLADIVGNAADDVLVRYVSGSMVEDTFENVQQVSVLDGATGTEYAVGAADATVSAPVFELAQAGGPFDVGTRTIHPAYGDGRVVAGITSEDGFALVSAYRPGERRADWTTPVRTTLSNAIATEVGDLTGDGHTELVLAPIGMVTPSTLAVLDGAGGHVLFTRSGRSAYRVHPGQVTVLDSTSHPGAGTVSWTTVDPAGTALRTHTLAVPNAYSSTLTPAGDVQRDGYTDAILDVAPGLPEHRAAVVDGRTGAVLWWGHRLFALGADVVDVAPAGKGAVRLTRRDGVTGHVLWRRDVRFSGYLGGEVDYGHVDGDAVPDLLFTPYSMTGIGTVVLSGATGRVLDHAGSAA